MGLTNTITSAVTLPTGEDVTKQIELKKDSLINKITSAVAPLTHADITEEVRNAVLDIYAKENIKTEK